MPTTDETLQEWHSLYLTLGPEHANPSKTYIRRFDTSTQYLDEDASPLSSSHPDAPGPESDGLEMVFARYTLGRELGRGGMGLVQAAHQDPLYRQVALKTVFDRQLQPYLIQEARVAGSLVHPNIVSVHDLLYSPTGDAAISMQLANGKPWSVRRAEAPKLRLLEELEILLKVAQAVTYAHAQGVLHNDLKPENVMIGEHGDVVLMDWGCAAATERYLHGDIALRRAATISSPFGTPCYMPPELAKGAGESVGEWTDTYLLGAILYEILEDRPLRSGTDFMAVLQRAIAGEVDPLRGSASPFLADICMRALKPRPEDRYATAQAFIDDLRNYFSVRAAERLAQQAEQTLQACSRDPGPQDRAVLLTLQQTCHTFEQAHELWPGLDHLDGMERTRACIAEVAMDLGDFALAQAHVDCLPQGAHDALRQRLQDAQDSRARQQLQQRRVRAAAIVLSICLVLGLVIGNVVVSEQRAIAEAHLRDLEDLSAIQLYQELSERETELWPASPRLLADLTQWYQEADGLVLQLPHYRQRQALLTAELGGQDRFEDRARRWEYETLQHLVLGLEALEAELVPSVQDRIDQARELDARSRVAHAQQWDTAIAAIAASERYQGLVLTPQLGLVPLGANAQGLWEFGHLLSGALPERDAGGALEFTEETGVVLVLLPAGEFLMGASAAPGLANHDPRAAEIEQPAHPVKLDAFFIARHELNQAQWLRVQSANPSAYLPGQTHGDHTVSLLHPVEHMTWVEASETAARLALVLPTEAQWEYANRAGSQSIYWGGDTIASMRGKLNISDRVSRERGGPASWQFEAELDDGYIVHAPVGTFVPNAFGLYDTAGNVWEWCADRFGAYTLPTDPRTGHRQVPDPDAPRLFRGGGFRASSVHARSADRYSIYAHDYSAFDVGLRPARLIDLPETAGE